MVVSYPISLEVKEPNNDIGILRIRQSDEESQTLVVQVLEYGLKKSYEGLQIFFCAKLGQTSGLGIIEQKLLPSEMTDPKNGKFEYTMRAEDWQQLGHQTAYFSFRKMKDDHTYVQQFSTRDFTYEVTKNIYSDGIKEVTKDGSTYVWTFEDLLRLLQEFKDSGETDFLAWFDEIKDQLSEDAAGNLMLLYQSLRDKTGSDNDFRPFESELSFMKRVYNESYDRGVNIRWFVEDGKSLNDAINELLVAEHPPQSIVVPKGNYVIDGPIVINRSVEIDFAKGAVLNVVNIISTPNDGAYPIIDIGADVEIGRVSIKGLNIAIPKIENLQTIGIRINKNKSLNSPVVDCVINDVRVQGADVGIETAFCWGISFNDIRLQSCVQPLKLNSQTNNVSFNNCSFVSFLKSNTFWNCEGVAFNSCEFANANSSIKHANEMYQSSLIFTNTYIEYILNTDVSFLKVGSYNDQLSSSVAFLGGKSTDSKVIILLSSSFPTDLFLIEPQSSLIEVKSFEDGQSQKSVVGKATVPSNMMNHTVANTIKKFDGTANIQLDNAYGGGNITKNFDSIGGKITIQNAGSDSNGIKIDGLIKGETYTFCYCSKTGLPFKNGDLLNSNLSETKGNIYYLPFVANSTTLRLLLDPSKSFEIEKLALIKGVAFPVF
ncbi:BppU family phage baseplate upper protein [Enterococcus gallinarum]|uniref:BppU family phage baseplate upper protein n=1 Tax=Enterococcus gallinarum TaxID=1353 RepID=UPI00391CE157